MILTTRLRGVGWFDLVTTPSADYWNPACAHTSLPLSSAPPDSYADADEDGQDDDNDQHGG